MKNPGRGFLTKLLSTFLFSKGRINYSVEKINENFSCKGRTSTAASTWKLYGSKANSIFRFSYIALLIVVSSSAISAQQLGNYPFTSLLLASCPNTNNTVSGPAANVSFSAYTNVGATCEPSVSAFENSGLNQLSTVNPGEYNEFTITPSTGYALTLSSLTFNHYSSVKPIANWYVRSSVDGYAENIGSGTITSSNQLVTLSLSPASFTNIGAVTFRFYVTGAQTLNAVWINDNVTVNGYAFKIPSNPPNPTSNSPQCANPGVTLSRTGSPSGSEVWYWQTTSTGTSTAKPEATCTVNTSGT